MLGAEPQYQLYANASPDQTGHQVVLHGLNTWRDYTNPDGTKKRLFFGVDNFSGTEPDWNSTTLIYGSKHPSVSYRKNKDSALVEAGGREVGSFQDAATILNGSPRFEGSFVFNDPEVQALHDAGELQFSSGFLADIDDEGKLTGKVVPDHILLFKKSKDGLQPQEPCSLFLNATEKNMDSDIKGIFNQILDAIKALTPAKGQTPVTNATDPETKPTMTDEPNPQIAVLNATIETQTAALTEKDATIADLTGKVQAFETEKAQAAEAAQEAAWQNIKTNILAPGLTATPELETEQKTEWLKDKDSFYCNAIAAAATRPQPKGKSGEMFANAAGLTEDAEMDAIFSAQPGVPGRFH